MASNDPKAQVNSLDGKLAITLHKLGEVYKVLLLEAGKKHGLSPIQVQILLFVAYHEDHNMRTVSFLAQELNLSRPTISDAVKALFQKKMIEKTSNKDTRSYSISLSNQGLKMTKGLDLYDDPVLKALNVLDLDNKSNLLEGLLKILMSLENQGTINTHRMCLTCKHFEKQTNENYCNLLKVRLTNQDLRIDCEEYTN